MHDEQLDQTRSHGKLMRWGMMACYVVMLLPIGGYFIAGGTISGVWANFGAFTPLLLCVGAHLVVHKFMGKSCHDQTDDAIEQVEPIKRQVAPL